MSLERSSLVLVIAAAVLGVVVAAALVITSTRLHVAARRLGHAVESVRISQELAVELASLRDDGLAGGIVPDGELRGLLRDARLHVDGPREATTMTRLTGAVDRYLVALGEAVRRDTPEVARDETRGEFEAAFALARELGRVNVDQSRAATRTAARWDRTANALGIAAVVVFTTGLGGAAWWMRRRAFRPAVRLVESIERFATGDRSARAAEEGPAEFRAIAHRFNTMAEALADKEEAQLAFLAGVAHDLRNPLTALRVATEMVAPDQPLPPEHRMRQLFARVHRQTERMERMVFDFLDAAQIESGRLELQIERCDARDLARAIVDLFEPAARNHQLVLELPAEPVELDCDPFRIEQVLTNLVSNAIKYSPRGGRVRVAVAREAGGVLLAVTDEGIGIAEQELEHVFEPFRRTGTSAEAIAGVGLGLFVARRIVEAHGGRVSMASTIGKGTTVAVHLPRASAGATARGPFVVDGPAAAGPGHG
jgi:signal transduction histidine kinase